MTIEQQQRDLMPDAPIPDDALDHLDDVPPEARKKWPRDLIVIIAVLNSRFNRMGYSDADASKLTYNAVQELASYCGGRYFYLPKGDVLERAIRDGNLYDDWADRHMTPDQLAGKYRVTVQHVYRIIKEQRAYHQKKVQPTLF
ncbi:MULTISPECIES: Mor transcription activator family protein [unclassified Oceanobacter]|uniref:Mor transcription activator family protein n=1 Tax=unclassified Oceanobacter TaxID=2620260 RepID=UPI002733E9F8|nr:MULTISPECIES: Mor transcription activator family protein [unclassified Oceanobacter]MDP2607966.1 Mor transcription activator family protein [Oceanobacter sp. 1_MG-2023]MDP2611372.1 Mor transcription activator family protein [Oceanobacter sp. 2_MG-2023]